MIILASKLPCLGTLLAQCLLRSSRGLRRAWWKFREVSLSALVTTPHSSQYTLTLHTSPPTYWWETTLATLHNIREYVYKIQSDSLQNRNLFLLFWIIKNPNNIRGQDCQWRGNPNGVKSCIFCLMNPGSFIHSPPTGFLIHYNLLWRFVFILSGGHQSAAKENKSRCRIVNQC